MKINYLLFLLPFFLTGCVGSLIWEDTDYWTQDFPNFTGFPDRCTAMAPRPVHQEDEVQERLREHAKLDQEREQIKARDQALRERAFSGT